MPADSVPIFENLQEILDDFESLLTIHDPVAEKPGIFGASLPTAHCQRKEALLRPQAFTGVLAYLDSLEKLGIRGITISLCHPLYTPGYPGYNRYQVFYKRVIREAKKRGLKIAIESQALLSNTGHPGFLSNRAGFSFEQYKKEAKEMFQKIIDELAPDYLTIMGEPDTMAALSGFGEFSDPEKCTEFVNYCLDGLVRGNTRIAAGIGNWGNLEQVRNFVLKTSVDCISLHVYTVTGKSLENIFFVADMARLHKKGLIIGSAWLCKTENLPDRGCLMQPDLLCRNVFSYWARLDQQFLACMVKFSRLQGVEYFSASGTDYFFAYVKHNSDNAGLGYKELSALQHKKEVTNLLANAFSSTGLQYKRLIEEKN